MDVVVVDTDGVEGGVLMQLRPREPFGELEVGTGDGMLYRRCSRGTRSASIDSHCFVKCITQRVQASTRFEETSVVLRQGKCITCEFMCSADVDNHSIWPAAKRPRQTKQLEGKEDGNNIFDWTLWVDCICLRELSVSVLYRWLVWRCVWSRVPTPTGSIRIFGGCC